MDEEGSNLEVLTARDGGRDSNEDKSLCDHLYVSTTPMTIDHDHSYACTVEHEIPMTINRTSIKLRCEGHSHLPSSNSNINSKISNTWKPKLSDEEPSNIPLDSEDRLVANTVNSETVNAVHIDPDTHLGGPVLVPVPPEHLLIAEMPMSDIGYMDVVPIPSHNINYVYSHKPPHIKIKKSKLFYVKRSKDKALSTDTNISVTRNGAGKWPALLRKIYKTPEEHDHSYVNSTTTNDPVFIETCDIEVDTWAVQVGQPHSNTSLESARSDMPTKVQEDSQLSNIQRSESMIYDSNVENGELVNICSESLKTTVHAVGRSNITMEKDWEHSNIPLDTVGTLVANIETMDRKMESRETYNVSEGILNLTQTVGSEATQFEQLETSDIEIPAKQLEKDVIPIDPWKKIGDEDKCLGDHLYVRTTPVATHHDHCYTYTCQHEIPMTSNLTCMKLNIDRFYCYHPHMLNNWKPNLSEEELDARALVKEHDHSYVNSTATYEPVSVETCLIDVDTWVAQEGDCSSQSDTLLQSALTDMSNKVQEDLQLSNMQGLESIICDSDVENGKLRNLCSEMLEIKVEKDSEPSNISIDSADILVANTETVDLKMESWEALCTCNVSESISDLTQTVRTEPVQFEQLETSEIQMLADQLEKDVIPIDTWTHLGGGPVVVPVPPEQLIISRRPISDKVGYTDVLPIPARQIKYVYSCRPPDSNSKYFYIYKSTFQAPFELSPGTNMSVTQKHTGSGPQMSKKRFLTPKTSEQNTGIYTPDRKTAIKWKNTFRGQPLSKNKSVTETFEQNTAIYTPAKKRERKRKNVGRGQSLAKTKCAKNTRKGKSKSTKKSPRNKKKHEQGLPQKNNATSNNPNARNYKITLLTYKAKNGKNVTNINARHMFVSKIGELHDNEIDTIIAALEPSRNVDGYCNSCIKQTVFDSNKDFVKHFQLLHASHSRQNPQWYVCPLCFHNTTSPAELIEHFDKEHQSQPLKCVYCSGQWPTV